ncbi:MarR family transcriptional regulator [Amycolatopsis sp. NPDC005232]|uniref:MarR family winged helix-turn-helix transcriptional regulator n=1 Tax=unclassified Amycolatopsis TaxID=2618356 RepID=UPI001C6A5737|nr:MarR family transcriptional regulator [Amycolatopsis sp. DSM 110486]QYN22118.1 MarR family transcriptional regulator [Amycolatopsis sp. DSM 110486]
MTHRQAAPRWLDSEELQTWRSFTYLLHRLPTELEKQLREDSQLSYVEYYALAGLSEEPGRRMRLSELAILTNAELSRLSHLISRLEKRGFLYREPDPEDGRYTHAVLTEAGYAHVLESAPGHVERVRELVYDVLSETELRTLRTAADKITRRIEADG